MNKKLKSRRGVLAKLLTVAGSTLVFRNSQAALNQTPKAAEGPFYPTESMRMDDVDNDLVKVEGAVKEAGGEIITLSGQVNDKNGKPLSGLRVEIWQCDVNGKYLHTGDNRKLAYDKAFQGFGHDITNEKGEYSFRTIKPTKYPGRTPHIHVKVCIEEKELLTTQFYIDGEPDNNQDSLYRRLSNEDRAAVSMAFESTGSYPLAIVNLVV